MNEKNVKWRNQIHNFILCVCGTFCDTIYYGSGTVINYGFGSDIFTSYGSCSGSTWQKGTVPTVPLPVPQHFKKVRSGSGSGTIIQITIKSGLFHTVLSMGTRILAFDKRTIHIFLCFLSLLPSWLWKQNFYKKSDHVTIIESVLSDLSTVCSSWAGSGARSGIYYSRSQQCCGSDLVLDVNFWGMKTSPVAWTSFMEAQG